MSAWSWTDVECLVSESATSKFDLTFVVTDTGNDYWVDIEYCSDLFDEVRIERMFGHLATILDSLTAAPEAAIGEAQMLTPAERVQILMEWSVAANA